MKHQQKFLLPEATDTPPPFSLSLRGQDAKHICRVLRAEIDDTLCFTDGKGKDFTGQIREISPKAVEIEIQTQTESQTESPLELTLCCGLLKHQKMDKLIKELSQLGVTRLLPFSCQRSIPDLDPKKLNKRMERWQTIAKEALKQCRRSRVMEICSPLPFKEILDLSQNQEEKIIFWEHSAHPLARLRQKKEKKIARAMVLIGPEGGLAEQEVQRAQDTGFKAYSLGPRILRAETAAVTAAALVQHLLGDL